MQENLTHSVTSISAGGNLALAAGNDLLSQGTQLRAGNQLGLAAGHDMTLNAVTDSQSVTSKTASGHTVTNTSTMDETLRGTTLSGANGVAATVGHDLTATAATLSSANGNVALGAGNDLTLNAGSETHTSTVDTKTTSGNWNSHSTTRNHDSVSDTDAVGTAISGNAVTLTAGHDLTAQAAQVQANGAIYVAAGHDVNLTDAHDVHSEEHDVSKTSSRTFNTNVLDPRFGNVDPDKRSSNSTQSITQSTSVGTLLSGDSVTVAAGHDLTGTNAQVVGTHDVVMAAGNNFTLNAGQNTYTEADTAGKSHTGVMNGGGLSVMAGKRTTTTTTTINDVSYSGSTVGSTDGSVTLSAGNTVHITGSDVLSQTGTTIVGKNVTIDAAVGTSDTTQTYKQSQAGIHAGLGGALAQVANNVIGDAQRGQQVNDPRLKALYAAKTAYDVDDLSKVAGNAQATQGASDSNPGGISLQIGIGAASASSKTTTHDETAYGSTIKSKGNVTIAATGGDLNVIGSQISGDNVALAAANNINLLSQAEQHTLKSDNKNASGEVGVQIGTDGIGFYAQASVGKGNAHGNGTTHTDTTVNASDTLTLISGGDTTIQGAQAKGNTVLANIGGDLNIASEQDTDDYASKQMQASGKVVVGMGASASGSYNQSKADSHYASVTEVSGIGAGDGGFEIHVNGNTDLKGGVIASTADASKNVLDTGSLTYSNIANDAKYSASSFGVSGGSAGGGGSIAPSIGIPQGDSEHSTTKAGIASGTIITRNGSTDLSGLDRSPDINASGLKPIFDQQKIEANQEMASVAGQVGFRAAGDIAGQMGWTEGSPERTILHGVVGAGIAALGGGNVVGGAVGAAANQLVINEMANYLVSQGYNPRSGEFATMLQLGSAAIGAAVGGGTGAATALDGTQHNYLTHQQVDALNNACKEGAGSPACQQAVAAAKQVSDQQNETMIANCTSDPTGSACQSALHDANVYSAGGYYGFNGNQLAGAGALMAQDVSDSSDAYEQANHQATPIFRYGNAAILSLASSLISWIGCSGCDVNYTAPPGSGEVTPVGFPGEALLYGAKILTSAAASEAAAADASADSYGVAFFGKSNLSYYTADNATLGANGRAFFFMPAEDSTVVVDASSAARFSGNAPSALDAYMNQGKVYGISFPSNGMQVSLPTASDAAGWPHFLEGGNTAVSLPNSGAYLVNPTREFVIPGGNTVPQNSVLFQLGPNGEWIPLRHF